MPYNICCEHYYKNRCHHPLAPKHWPALSPVCIEEFPVKDARLDSKCKIREPYPKPALDPKPL